VKHTPGPWRAGYESEQDQPRKMLVRAEESHGQPYVAICYPAQGQDDHIANASLIATDPALLSLARRVYAEQGPRAITWPDWECRSCYGRSLAPESITHVNCLWRAAEAILREAGEA
jgi:hypothetical protein